MTDQREIEAKFEADAAFLQQLLDLQEVAGFAVVRQAAKDQDDLYFDSATGHLKQAGASLRIRRKGAHAEVTFKGERTASPDDPHVVSRLEDEVALPGFDPGELALDRPIHLDPEPSPLARARALAGQAELYPVARMQTNRTVLMATNGDVGAVELAVDRCVAIRIADQRSVEFVEVEAELKDGPAEVLNDVLTGLTSAVPGLRPSTKTKLERALG